MLEKDNAILLRRVHYSNSSLIISMLTRQGGVRELIAKGVRRPKNPHLGVLDWFAEGELVWYPGRNEGLDTLAHFDPDTIRLALRAHPERFAAAAFCCELVAATTPPHYPEPETFEFLHDALSHLDAGGDAARAAIVFALNYLRQHGLSPALDACGDCGAAIGEGEAFLAGERGVCLCSHCARMVRTDPLPPSVLETLRYFSRTPFARADRLHLNPRARVGTLSTVIRMIESQFGRGFRSAVFLLHQCERGGAAERRAS